MQIYVIVFSTGIEPRFVWMGSLESMPEKYSSLYYIVRHLNP